MYDKVVSNDPFTLKYCLGRYKNQEMCDEAVDDFLPTLRFVSDWFVTSKKIKKLDNNLFSTNDMFFVNENSNYVTFFSEEMGTLSVDHEF